VFDVERAQQCSVGFCMTTFQHGEPKRRSGAFTLIEIILVLSIIALL
jgi:prepilin-type N-terminal cleavage/methylation domain-containing protein